MNIDPRWENWARRLNGEKLPMHADHAECGFWEWRSKNKHRRPVAFIPIDSAKRMFEEIKPEAICNGFVCVVNSYPWVKRFNSDIEADGIWAYAVQRPISEETYRRVAEDAEPWPDENEAVTRDNQAPDDDSYEALSDRIDDLAREAQALCRQGAAKTKEEADAAADLADRLSKLATKADAARKREKAPHDDAVKTIQARWNPLITKANVYAEIKRLVTTPFLVAEEKKASGTREESVKAGEAPPPRESVKVGTVKSQALREFKIVKIVDRAKVLAFFADSQTMTDVLQDMAERAVRAKVDVPGVEVKVEKRAV